MNSTYDVVMPTKNRPEALSLSIPSILNNQHKLPQQLIIVDASDEKFNVKETIQSIQEQCNFEINYIKSPKANSSFQRNLGLEKVTADVTVFPDDDSIFYPGAIDEIMRIYEKDSNQLIAGVCAAEALAPPPDFPLQQAYPQNRSDSIKKKIGSLRYKVEHWLVPDPFHSMGQKFIAESKYIPWLPHENTIKVEYMTGFRMSFRSSVIKHIKFNDVFDAYCLGEDIDASFSAYKEGALVGARNAKIYHHKFPTKRGGGYALGLWQILNRAYIVAKHCECNSATLAQLKKFTYYKLLLYSMSIYTAYGRDRFRGAYFATKNIDRIIHTKKQHLDNNYSDIVRNYQLFSAK